MNKVMKRISIVALVSLMSTGCVSTTQKLIKKSELEVSTKMSQTIWLDPVSQDKQTVYLQFRNTSDKELSIKDMVTVALKNKGYKVETDPSKAHYWIQANILKVGKSDPEEAKNLLGHGYGNAIAGAVVGSQFGGGKGSSAMALAGAAFGAAADAIWEDVLYVMVTDLQISERAKEGVIVNQSSNHSLAQGNSGRSVQVSSETTNRKKYQTRIVSSANKINLAFDEALPTLEQGLTRSISGIL